MAGPVIIQKFDENNPPTIAALNTALQAIVAAVNALGAEPLLQFGASPGAQSAYLPVAGGTLYGQIVVPSILIGPTNPPGPQYAAVHKNDKATAADYGLVKQGVAAANLTQAITNPPTQAEVQAIQTKVNDLLTSLRNATVIAT